MIFVQPIICQLAVQKKIKILSSDVDISKHLMTNVVKNIL